MNTARWPGQRRRRFLRVLTSLWVPVLAAAFGVGAYLVWVEYAGPSMAARAAVLWLVLFCVAWWLTLGAVSFFFPSIRVSRLRREASDLLEDIAQALRRARHVSPPLLQALKECAQRLETAWLEGAEGALSREKERTQRAADEALPGWRRGEVRVFARGVLQAFGVAVLLRVAVIEPFAIPSGSMLPTLQVGDFILVNKLIYGIQIPFLQRVPFVMIRPPARGDVVVFNNPLDDSINLVKRVVGVPGDQIEIIDEVVHVNGVPQPRQEISTLIAVQDRTGEKWFPRDVAMYRETFGGKSHLTLQYLGHPMRGQKEGPYLVPAGHVFVLGDNRDGSEDSRAGFGLSPKVEFVPWGHIKGKAMVVWLSLGPQDESLGVFGGLGLRRERLFLPVE